MKNIFVLISFIFSFCSMNKAIAQCENSQITASKSAIAFNIFGDAETVIITSKSAWRLAFISADFRMSPAMGNAGSTEVTIRTSSNSGSPTTKSGRVIFTNTCNKSVSIALTQGSGCSLSVITIIPSPSASFGVEGGRVALNIQSANTNWRVSGSIDGFSVNETQGGGAGTSFTITASPNNSPTKRTGVYTVTNGCGKVQTIEVSQDGTCTNSVLSVTPSVLSFSEFAGSQRVVVNSSANWSLSGLPAGFTANKTSGGSGATEVIITTVKNTSLVEKAATLTIKSNCKEVNLRITQAKTACANSSVSLSVGSLAFPAILNFVFSESLNFKKFTINATHDWTITGDGNGFIATPKSGVAGTTEVIISASPNKGAVVRRSSFTVTNVCQKTAVLTVSQDRLCENTILTATPNPIAFEALKSSKTIQITSTESWTLPTGSRMVTFSPSSGGVGTTTINVAVSLNTTTLPRSESFAITNSCGKRTTLTVQQKGGTGLIGAGLVAQNPLSISTIKPLKQPQFYADLLIYPNPTYETHINIDFKAEQETDASVEIIDAAGKRVLTRQVAVSMGQNQVQLPVEKLPTGLYVVKLGEQMQKLQIMR